MDSLTAETPVLHANYFPIIKGFERPPPSSCKIQLQVTADAVPTTVAASAAECLVATIALARPLCQYGNTTVPERVRDTQQCPSKNKVLDELVLVGPWGPQINPTPI